MRDRLHAMWVYVCGLDPGSIRSLIWVAMGAMGMDQGETALTYVAGFASVALGLLSAAMPAKKP